MKELILLIAIITNLSIATAKPLSFEECSKKLLNGLSLEEFKEQHKNRLEEKDFKKIDRIIVRKNCIELLHLAKLSSNGLLENRHPLSSQILKTFVTFHRKWLMPTDYDIIPKCNDTFHNDVYDFKAPAYHLTRALFQPDRKASLAVTAYADLRSLRAGENPKISPNTGITSEQYQKLLKLNEELPMVGEGDLLGFLFKQKLEIKEIDFTPIMKHKKSFEKTLEERKSGLHRHLGAGLIGSPAFLIHYAPKGAYRRELYQSDGKTKLPRILAKSILENLLCENLASHKYDDEETFEWKHPITQEKSCLNCHHSLDNLASGLRNLTYIKSKESCSADNPQILLPQYFVSSFSKKVWSPSKKNGDNEDNKEQEFYTSYPVGNLKGDKENVRFVGLRQLGQVIANDKRFYQCQVKKYFQFLYKRPPSHKNIVRWATEYQNHQDGLRLFKTLIEAGDQS